MEEQGVFKNSMFGFDKQSVLTYVDELMSRSREREEELQKLADERTRERDSLLAQVSELKARSAAMEDSLAKVGDLQRELNIKNARIEELESKLLHTAQRAAQLEASVAQKEKESRRYDEVAAQVGAVMVEAQKQADVIVGRARDQAGRVAQESVERVYEINQRIDQVKGEIRRLRTFAVDTFEDVDQRMQSLEAAIEEAEGQLYAGATAQPGDGQPPYQEEAGTDSYQPEKPYEAVPPPAPQNQQKAARPDRGFFAQPCQS